MEPLLFLVALLSTTGTLVDCSASIKTSCDMPSNVTCFQNSCSQQPCPMICGLGSAYHRCVQQCNGSTCYSMVCTNAVNNCYQKCPGGVCPSLTCGSNICLQNCSSGNCGRMQCNAKNTTICVQSAGKEMTCDSERCEQNCPGGNCNMTCLSNVKDCLQNCNGGVCFYQCAAKKCNLECTGGKCTEIKSSVTSRPTDHTPKSTGARLEASHVLGLTFVLLPCILVNEVH